MFDTSSGAVCCSAACFTPYALARLQVEDIIVTNKHAIVVLPLLGKPVSELHKFVNQNIVGDLDVCGICMAVLSAIGRLAALQLCPHCFTSYPAT